MKKILILGAGLVSRPGVAYLLEQGYPLTVASRTLGKAQKLVDGFSNGNAVQFDVADNSKLESLVQQHDIVVSLLPYIHHVKVAESCLKYGKDMATTSYVSEGMRSLDKQAKEKGLTFLNEIGVDPGIDHMSAMKIIDGVQENGGKIKHFYSFCGGLPAPDDNDNPFGYKFSWSPKGVVLASKNSARYLEDGRQIDIEGEDLFLNKRIESVDTLGDFEVYPNRDSIPYKDIYGLEDAETVMRGTYRNIGWCGTLKKMVDLGLVDDTPDPGLSSISYLQMMAQIAGVDKAGDVVGGVARKAGIDKDHFAIKNLEWLGMFEDTPVPAVDNKLDVLSERLLERLKYRQGEKDMLILKHKFVAENKDGLVQTITSTLIDYGIPHGDSSMARTVSLPLALGVKLMADGQINRKGVLIPTDKDIYEPVLNGLETLGIKMVEQTFPGDARV